MGRNAAFRDAHNPLMADLVSSVDTGAASYSAPIKRDTVSYAVHAPHMASSLIVSAEVRHERLTNGERLDRPLNENGAYACALGTCNPEWDCIGHIVEYTKPMASTRIVDAAPRCAYCGSSKHVSRVWAR